MSDLQIALISVGVILILVLVLFNWWQDRRTRQRMQAHFPQVGEDPLMGAMTAAVRREPGIGVNAADGDAYPFVPTDADPICEAVIDVVFSRSVTGAQLHEAVRSIDKVGTKPVRVLVEHESGHTEQIRENGSYLSVQLAILLANRSGALTDIEWSHLWTMAQRLAERFEGSVEGPEQADVLEKAQQLDRLCASLDAQVGLAVRLDAPVGAESLRQVAKDVGFMAHGLQWVWMSESAMPRFSLLFDGVAVGQSQSSQVGKLDLLLDVPCSQADEQAFSRMASVGRDLAARLGGTLIDDQGMPVAEAADHAIDKTLHELYQNLEKAGFPGADARTIRLFS